MPRKRRTGDQAFGSNQSPELESVLVSRHQIGCKRNKPNMVITELSATMAEAEMDGGSPAKFEQFQTAHITILPAR